MKTEQFNVSSYLSSLKDNTKRLNEVERELRGLEKLTLPPERLIRNRMHKELIEEKVNLIYSKLDLSFLEMGQNKEFIHNYEKGFWNSKKLTEKITLSVPKFGVYSLNNPFCSINIKNSVSDNDGMGGIIGGTFGGMIGMAFGGIFPLIHSPSDYNLNLLGAGLSGAIIGGILIYYLMDKSSLEKKIEFTTPGIFNKHLMKSFDFSKFLDVNNGEKKYSFYEFSIPKEINEEYKRLGDIRLSSNFNCTIPQKIKKKIKEAQSMFGDEIYFIKEMKPEDWNVEKEIIVQKDPLVVGINNNNCFYIDSFDPTPLEAYFFGNGLRKN